MIESMRLTPDERATVLDEGESFAPGRPHAYTLGNAEEILDHQIGSPSHHFAPEPDDEVEYTYMADYTGVTKTPIPDYYDERLAEYNARYNAARADWERTNKALLSLKSAGVQIIILHPGENVDDAVLREYAERKQVFDQSDVFAESMGRTMTSVDAADGPPLEGRVSWIRDLPGDQGRLALIERGIHADFQRIQLVDAPDIAIGDDVKLAASGTRYTLAQDGQQQSQRVALRMQR